MIDDYIEACKIYLPPSKIAELLQENCNYHLLMTDWDRIFMSYDNYLARLRELDVNFRSGKYTLNIEIKKEKSKKTKKKKKK